MERTLNRILAAVAGAALAGAASPSLAARGTNDAGWSYSGKTGPTHWAKLDRSFAACGSGQAQSPIDIPDADARKGDLPALLFNYKPSPLDIVDDEHAIEVHYAPGSVVSVAGKRYELQQIRFRHPSEHKIGGKGHDMEAQLVHKSADGKLAVVAVFLDAGKDNKAMKTLAANLPSEKGKERKLDAVGFNALDLLPGDKGYYSFAGSLTTPPCTEGVTWFVLKTPVQLTADEMARLIRATSDNARPVQPVNGRDIKGTI
ncbi:MAG TPA: carbonic anhydrase family protein [Casimicrobiaceae bacterium]|nr:carbonic anhydrase family protein [Casimicrobiaceae bacterium]